MGDSSSVREGFLCPICMADLGDLMQLQVHFEEQHSREDPAILRNLKDLFGKAKKKILKDGEEASAAEAGGRLNKSLLSAPRSRNASVSPKPVSLFGAPRPEDLRFHPVSGVPKHLLLEDLPPPPVTRHWDAFWQERKRRLDRNKSANLILVRLEKLLRGLPGDPAKRRAHEQSVVPWISEELVSRCPTCARDGRQACCQRTRSFTLARRKHHCRLCGGIMCKDCSDEVPLELARRVINPASIARFRPSESETAAAAAAPASVSAATTPKGSKFRLSGSQDGASPLMNIMELRMSAESGFLACTLCKSILEKQDEKSEAAASEPPLIVLLFQRLQEHMRDGRVLAKEYTEMQRSLASGEDTYDLEEAKYLRVKLLKVGEAVGAVSKRIETLNTDPEGERMASRAELTLQMRVRSSAVNFVKSTLVVLPSLPSEEEHERLKARRKEEAERRVQEERDAARRAKEKLEQQASNTSPNKDPLGKTIKNINSRILNQSSELVKQAAAAAASPSQQKDGVNYGQGFVLTSSGGANGSDFTASEDPMVQQIHNIRSYILEARRMGRYEEVATLEENLKDLQAEYQRMQEERRELEENFNSFRGIFHKTSPMTEQPPASTSEVKTPPEEEEEIPDMDEYDASGKNPFA